MALIEDQLRNLAEGSAINRKELSDFYQLFLDSNFIVPRRDQEVDLSAGTVYDNEFSDLLGVNTNEAIYLPAFTSNEALSEWYRGSLKTVSIKGSDLLKRISSHWWLTINPGSEWGKEFSPWEIEKLSSNHSEDLEELIEEQLSEAPIPVHFRQLETDEIKIIEKAALRFIAMDVKSDLKIFGGKHLSELGEKYILAIISKNMSKALQDTMQNLLSQELIGDSSFEVHFADSLDACPETALFKFSNPIFEYSSTKHKGVISKIVSMFNKRFTH